MSLRMPSDEDLRVLAQTNHFNLNDEELAAFRTLTPGFFELYEQLYQMPEDRQPIKYPDRDPGHRPSRAEDPYNAILYRCTLRGASSGKLAGKRIGLKNNVSVAGMPMTCGTLLLRDYVADTDATIVTRVLDEGAEITALLNLENFCFSGAGDTSTFGAVLNPHDTNHLAGGSSGGSGAALFYDDIDITIGGDQGGSIRIPASWCGVVGLKPTHGLVPYTGIVGIDNTCDHTGPMARTVADVALAMEAIAGKDTMDPRQAGDVPVEPYTELLGRGIAGLRIGVLAEGFGTPRSEPDVDESVRKAVGILSELGANVGEVSVPVHREAPAIVQSLILEGATALIRSNGMGHHWEGLYMPNLAESLGKAILAQGDDLPPTVKLFLMIGTYMHERYHGRMYAKAQNLRPRLRAGYDEAFEQFDLLVMPTVPAKAYRNDPDIDVLGIVAHSLDMNGNTAPFNLTGHPAITVPCGKSNGLPIGLMLVGRRFEDGTVMRAAHAFEQHVDWETL